MKTKYGTQKRVVGERIINILSKTPLTIAELSRELNIKRSTLIYYLTHLKSQKVIKYCKDTKKRGQPVKVFYTPQQAKKKLFKKYEERAKQFNKKYKSEIIKVLKIIKQNQPIDRKEIINLLAKEKDVIDVALVTSIYWKNLTKELVSLTTEGEQFLKQNAPTHSSK